MWRTPATRDGLARRRARRVGRVAGRVILAHRDELRRHLRRRRHRATARSRSNVISSQGVHDRYGGVVPEIASRHHLELVNAVVDDALRRAGRDARRRRRWSPSPRAPGWSARCSSGSPTAKALAAARAAAARRRSTTCTATSPPTSSSPTPFEPPFLCLIASGGHTLLAARRREHDRLRGARPARSTTPPARRSTRARGCSGSATPAARRSSASPRGGDPARLRLPGRRARRRAWTSPSPALKTALLYARARPRRGRRRARARADLAASYQHAIVEALAQRVERGAGGRPGSSALAARRRRRRQRRRCATRLAALGVDAHGPAARAVHRQRGDDRAAPRAACRPLPVPGLPRARRLRDGRARAGRGA